MPVSVMLRFVLVLLCCLMLPGCALADDQGCYTPGSVAGIVIATVVVTLVTGGLAAAFIWYLWKQRKAGYGENKSMEKPIMCPPMSPDKQMIARESNDYAFDNPYFKDDETERANPDAAEKGESGFRTDNGDIASSQNAKASNGTSANHQKRSRPFSSLPFHAVFLPSGKKQQRATMDDTYISKHLERITVPLRGHDFTGLGFNICGNMRDGIFVKDVLHRGPASESGKIKAGDRIVGVTVSFAAMVYEDALTILSYASPYDVRLEIEKAPATSAVTLPPSSPKRLGTSTSFRNNGQRRLFHPLYRSQSIDDLTQIGKDGFGVINTSGSQRESSSSNTPKRSQSVEASNGGLKTRPPFLVKTDEAKSPSSKGSRKSSTSSCESTAKAVTPTEKSQPVLNEEPCTKKEVKSARFRIQQVNVKTEAPAKVVPPAKPARESYEEKLQSSNDTVDKSSEAISKTSNGIPAEDMTKPEKPSRDVQNASESESDVSDKPTAPPRKSSNTPKRKAPAPPPVSAAKTETSAVVHRADDLQKQSPVTREKMSHSDGSEATLPPTNATNETACNLTGTFVNATQELQMATKEMPVFSSTEKMGDPGTGSSDTSSLTSGDNSSSKMDKDDQNTSPGKRKAASLGDLTKLEHGVRKTSISSAILERAVSLDLQQSIPGENLTKHKKILRAPAFEDDYLEDREDLTELNGQGLKRWDDGLDKVFAKLPNGSSKLDEEFNDELSPSAESVEKEEVNSSNLDSKTEINITSIQFKLDSNDTEIGTVLENNNFGTDKHREVNDNESNNSEINHTETISSPDISHTEMNKKQEINHSEINNNATINHAEINKNPEISHSEINSNVKFNGTESNNNPETNHDEIIRTVTNHSDIDDFDSALITESSTEKPAPDLRNVSPLRELPLPNLQDLPIPLTSTPVKKVIEVKGLLENDDDDIDDVPYLASAGDKNRDESSTKFTTKSISSSATLFPLVAINIPVIKPDLTQFEKLPSPPPASTHPALEPTWRMSKTLSLDDGGKTSLERITVQSLYKPIFTGKEINNIDEPLHPASPEKMVNGNESDASEHYSTAQENTSTSSVETSSISMTLSSPTAKEVIRTPNTIAGFAKTLIIPSPNDVENLLSLAAEPNTPPPVLESSAKSVAKE